MIFVYYFNSPFPFAHRPVFCARSVLSSDSSGIQSFGLRKI